MAHFPWDDGAISGTWLATGQKTIKTRCKKRVSFSAITLKGHVGCSKCRENLASRAVELETIVRDYPQHDTLGALSNMAQFLRKTLAQ